MIDQATRKMMTRQQLAKELGVSLSYLEKLAIYGGGPPLYKLGSRVSYASDEVANWLKEKRRG